MKYKNFRNCGFKRVCAVVAKIKPADVSFNTSRILNIMETLGREQISLIVFPELSVTGYTCADLFLQISLYKASEAAIEKIVEFSNGTPAKTLYVAGAPVRHNGKLYNCALFINAGKLLAIVPKTYIPNYGEFYERRWFESASGIENTNIDFGKFRDIPFGTKIMISHDEMTIGAEICEDLWVPVPPSSYLAMAGANVIVNLSASNAVLGKQRYRRDLILQQSARCRCAYIYASAGLGESSTDLSFPGYAAIAENGSMLNEDLTFHDVEPVLEQGSADEDYICRYAIADIDPERLENERIKFNTFTDIINRNDAGQFQIIKSGFPGYKDEIAETQTSDNLPINASGTCYPAEEYEIELLNGYTNPMPFVPSDSSHRNENCTEIINIQCHGLLQRLRAIGLPKMVIGVSGGLDSTLALLIAARTAKLAGMQPSDVVAITMPGLATTNRTHNNAWKLMTELGCTSLEIPIGDAVAQHFQDIDQDPQKFDSTYENSQARERTQILMDYANKVGGIVIGTGDLSELALGWCTYNGDHMSMYAVNTSVPKTLVKYLVEWFAIKTDNQKIKKILLDIIDTPISPELVPAKEGKDEIEQKTEDLVGPYELHDFFLFHLLRNSFSPEKIYYLAIDAFKGKYDAPTILLWLKTFYRRFFSQQFKRSCLPDGPKVGSVCLSPRGDWRMPSDASANLWLSIIDSLRNE